MLSHIAVYLSVCIVLDHLDATNTVYFLMYWIAHTWGIFHQAPPPPPSLQPNWGASLPLNGPLLILWVVIVFIVRQGRLKVEKLRMKVNSPQTYMKRSPKARRCWSLDREATYPTIHGYVTPSTSNDPPQKYVLVPISIFQYTRALHVTLAKA